MYSRNTTAKIITQFDPKLRTEDSPSQYLMDFVDERYYDPPPLGQRLYPPFEAHNVWQRESVIRKQARRPHAQSGVLA